MKSRQYWPFFLIVKIMEYSGVLQNAFRGISSFIIVLNNQTLSITCYGLFQMMALFNWECRVVDKISVTVRWQRITNTWCAANNSFEIRLKVMPVHRDDKFRSWCRNGIASSHESRILHKANIQIICFTNKSI